MSWSYRHAGADRVRDGVSKTVGALFKRESRLQAAPARQDKYE